MHLFYGEIIFENCVRSRAYTRSDIRHYNLIKLYIKQNKREEKKSFENNIIKHLCVDNYLKTKSYIIISSFYVIFSTYFYIGLCINARAFSCSLKDTVC